MINRIIIFLLRKRLHLKKNEQFQFKNQNSKNDYYYFTNTKIMKKSKKYNFCVESNVSLNWLLNKDCHIEKMEN